MAVGERPVIPGVDVIWRRSARARRFSLRVSRLDGRVTLTLPARAREAEAAAFLRGQADWIRQTLAGMPAALGVPVAVGMRLAIEGRDLAVVQGSGRSIRVEGAQLVVPGDPARAGARIGAWARVLARDRLAEASTRHAAALGVRWTALALRDTRSRWGSCSPDGRLMFSWRLILAPPRVLDYVAAHEVAHLVEMNHSPAFWAVVDRLFPGWQAERAWLRSEGAALHRYRFGD
jgi:predicted metal-dependent hydrolase